MNLCGYTRSLNHLFPVNNLSVGNLGFRGCPLCSADLLELCYTFGRGPIRWYPHLWVVHRPFKRSFLRAGVLVHRRFALMTKWKSEVFIRTYTSLLRYPVDVYTHPRLLLLTANKPASTRLPDSWYQGRLYWIASHSYCIPYPYRISDIPYNSPSRNHMHQKRNGLCHPNPW